MNDLFIIGIVIMILLFVDIKYAIIALIALYLLKEYSQIKHTVVKELKPPKVRINYNSKIENILESLKKFKKKSKNQYLKGIYYWNKFIKTVQILEDDSLQNYNPYFDKAFDYLKESVNYFHSINTDVPERDLVDGLKYNDFTNAKKTKEVAKLSKELYKEGYLILYNLSLKLNKKWKENPNINNKQIILDHPLPYNDKNTSFDFYI